MKILPLAASIITLVVLAACSTLTEEQAQSQTTVAATPQVYKPKSTLTDEEFASFSEQGIGSITGKAFLAIDDVGTVTCDELDVYLIPDTNLGKEYISVKWSGIISDEDAFFALKQVIKHTYCGKKGEFIFLNLPKANWIIMIKYPLTYTDKKGNKIQTRPDLGMLVQRISSTADTNVDTMLVR